MFGSAVGSYGRPLRWRLNPSTGAEWPNSVWSKVLRAEPYCGDVKLTWELGRFPHFFSLSRAAMFYPEARAGAAALASGQLRDFVAANRVGYGPHWASGQEVFIRLVAWQFAKEALGLQLDDWAAIVAESVLFIKKHIAYARYAVCNNHLLGEALGLYLFGSMLSGNEKWAVVARQGKALFTEAVERQFYEDGGYIQQSHTYHRLALEYLILAIIRAKVLNDEVPQSWLDSGERSLNFLFQQQNESDGRLPNYGANDGAMSLPLSSCDYSDFRPVLQTLSLLLREERLYEPGPWDEMPAWLLGSKALAAPLRTRERWSLSSPVTGIHTIRAEKHTFLTFRCGTLRDRFAQIDMLHMDFWWHGENVLVDGGSYLYNGPRQWHEYFFRTGSHNTVTVDGADQMVHFRRFKTIYKAEARLTALASGREEVLIAGEHAGYRRLPAGVVHRRSVLMYPTGFTVVHDQIQGKGQFAATLQWLGGPYTWSCDPTRGELTLASRVAFHLRVLDRQARALSVDVVAGRESPPRGWLSRYYASKVPVPSLECALEGLDTIEFVTLLGPSANSIVADGERWMVETGDSVYQFSIPLVAGASQLKMPQGPKG